MSDLACADLSAPIMDATRAFREGPCPGQFQHSTFFALVSIGHGGWTGYYVSHPGTSTRNATCSHYQETWREHEALRPDTLVVDLLPMADRALVEHAVRGPMVDVDLPAGMVSEPLNGRVLKPWQPLPEPFGNARGLDYVSLDVWVAISDRHDARIFRAGDER